MPFYKFHADFNTSPICYRLDSSLSDPEYIQGFSSAADRGQTEFSIKETRSIARSTKPHNHEDLPLDFQLSNDSGGLLDIDGSLIARSITTENVRSLESPSRVNPPPAMASACCHDSATSDSKTYHNVTRCTASGARLTIKYRKHRPSCSDDHNLIKTPGDASSVSAVDSHILSGVVNIDDRADYLNPDDTHINSIAKPSVHSPSTGHVGVSAGLVHHDHQDSQLAITTMDVVNQAPYLLNIDYDGQEHYQHLASCLSTTYIMDDPACGGGSSDYASNAALFPHSNASETCENLQQCEVTAEYCSSILRNQLPGKSGKLMDPKVTEYSPVSPPNIYLDHEDNPDITFMDVNGSNDLVDHEVYRYGIGQDAIPEVSEGIYSLEQQEADAWFVYRPELDEQIEMLNRNFPDPLVRLIQELPGSTVTDDAYSADADEMSVSDYFRVEEQYLWLQVDPAAEQNTKADMSGLAQSSWTAFFELDPLAPPPCQLEVEAYDQPPRAHQEEDQFQYNCINRQDSFSDHLSLITCATNVHSDSSASGRTITMTTKCKKLRKKRKRRISPLPSNMLQCLLSNGSEHRKYNVNQEAVINGPDPNIAPAEDEDEGNHHGQYVGDSLVADIVATSFFTYAASPSRRIRSASKGLRTSLTSAGSHYTKKKKKTRKRKKDRQDGANIRAGIFNMEQDDSTHAHSISQTAPILVALVEEAADIPLDGTSMSSTYTSDLGLFRKVAKPSITSRTKRSGTLSYSHKDVSVAESLDVDISHEATIIPPEAPAEHLQKRERSSRSNSEVSRRKESLSPYSCGRTVANQKRRYEPYIDSMIVSSRSSSSSLLPEAAVAIMRKWFQEHIDFPFADKDQKRDLVSASGLTLSQVENWLSNHRHRLKIKRTDYPSRKTSDK